MAVCFLKSVWVGWQNRKMKNKQKRYKVLKKKTDKDSVSQRCNSYIVA